MALDPRLALLENLGGIAREQLQLNSPRKSTRQDSMNLTACSRCQATGLAVAPATLGQVGVAFLDMDWGELGELQIAEGGSEV